MGRTSGLASYSYLFSIHGGGPTLPIEIMGQTSFHELFYKLLVCVFFLLQLLVVEIPEPYLVWFISCVNVNSTPMFSNPLGLECEDFSLFWGL